MQLGLCLCSRMSSLITMMMIWSESESSLELSSTTFKFKLSSSSRLNFMFETCDKCMRVSNGELRHESLVSKVSCGQLRLMCSLHTRPGGDDSIPTRNGHNEMKFDGKIERNQPRSTELWGQFRVSRLLRTRPWQFSEWNDVDSRYRRQLNSFYRASPKRSGLGSEATRKRRAASWIATTNEAPERAQFVRWGTFLPWDSLPSTFLPWDPVQSIAANAEE